MPNGLSRARSESVLMSSRTLRLIGLVVLLATLGAVSCQAFLGADDVAAMAPGHDAVLTMGPTGAT
jgi:hypothetical protein